MRDTPRSVFRVREEKKEWGVAPEVCSSLFSFFGHDLPRYRTRRAAQRFLRIVLLNPYNREILRRIPDLGLDDCWLTAGCLLQTVWNLRYGRRVDEDIRDYDLIYFDPNLSWKAEDAVIRHTRDLFRELPVHVEIRNQARVHLWYNKKFGVAYKALREARHALRRFPSSSTAIAITSDCNGNYLLYAPFGFRDALNLVVRPNRRLPIPNVYFEKTASWRNVWPQLFVEPWLEESDSP